MGSWIMKVFKNLIYLFCHSLILNFSRHHKLLRPKKQLDMAFSLLTEADLSSQWIEADYHNSNLNFREDYQKSFKNEV